MGEKKKVRVKVKKRKLNFKKIFIFLLILFLIFLIGYFVKDIPIKNIYIVGNNIIPDKDIIKESTLDTYPSFLMTSKRSIKKSLKNNDYIKEITIKKKFPCKVYIYITEKKVIAIYNDKLLLEDNSLVDNTYNITNVPKLNSDISSLGDKFARKFALLDDNILLKISEIVYEPNEVDKERFALYMNDNNLVYITLNKITKLNKYNSICSKMNDKNGIIYLDSGDFVELK